MKALLKPFKAWWKHLTCTHPNRAAIVRMHSYYHQHDIDAHGGMRSRWQCLLCHEDRLYSWHPEYYVAEKGDLVKWNFPRQVAVVFALLLVSSPALAQTPQIVDATSGVQFAPSPDHAALDAVGAPVVMAYELRFETQQSGCAVPSPQSLGKPAPALGQILVDPLPFFGTIPANCIYAGRIATIGQQNVMSLSPVSDPFVRVTTRTPAPAGKPVILP